MAGNESCGILGNENEIANLKAACSLVPLKFENNRHVLKPQEWDFNNEWAQITSTMPQTPHSTVRLTRERKKGKGTRKQNGNEQGREDMRGKKRRIMTDSQDA